MILGTEKALPVGAREKAESGDKAGERIFSSSATNVVLVRYLGKYVSLVLGEEDVVAVVVVEEVVVEVVEEVMDMIAMVVVSKNSLFLWSFQIYLPSNPSTGQEEAKQWEDTPTTGRTPRWRTRCWLPRRRGSWS